MHFLYDTNPRLVKFNYVVPTSEMYCISRPIGTRQTQNRLEIQGGLVSC